MNNLGTIHGQWDIDSALTKDYLDVFLKTGMLVYDTIFNTQEDLTQFLTPQEENPWHNITKQNQQYKWNI